MMTQQLKIKVRFQTEQIRRSMPCPVEVRLINQSSEPVMVNKRLGVGYRDSTDRELFAEVFRRGGHEVVSKETVLYQRDSPSSVDYVWLKPQQAVSTSFDFFEWYELPGPGEYDLVLSYRADDSPAGHPPELLTGIHSSERAEFLVVS